MSFATIRTIITDVWRILLIPSINDEMRIVGVALLSGKFTRFEGGASLLWCVESERAHVATLRWMLLVRCFGSVKYTNTAIMIAVEARRAK